MSVARRSPFGRSYVVHITSKQARGTGFVIRRGVVATALHVVAEDTAENPQLYERMKLTFSRTGPDNTSHLVTVDSDIRMLNFSVAQDWALIACPMPGDDDWPTIPPRAQIDIHAPFHSHGFARPEGKGLNGSIAGMTDRNGQSHIQLQVGQLLGLAPDDMPGCSGAPVVVDGHAVGILVLREKGQPEQLTRGATIYAIPMFVVRDENGLFVCPDLLIQDERRDAIRREVRRILEKSSPLLRAVVNEFGISHEINEKMQLDRAVDRVSDSPEINPLLDAALEGRESGAERTDVCDFLRHALSGSAEYIQMIAGFRQRLDTDRVAIVEFPVRTPPNLEIVRAGIDNRSARFKQEGKRLQGDSFVPTSSTRPDATIGPDERPTDQVFASAVCKLADRLIDEDDIHPSDVHSFLQHVRDSRRAREPHFMRRHRTCSP